jgi:hypothetical protein
MFNIRNVIKLNKFIHFKSFSSINLVTGQGVINRSENGNFNRNLNWELAKVWVTPSNNSFKNTLSPIVESSNEHCVVSSVGKITQLNFDRLFRKMGQVISRNSDVYVQDGVYKGKKLRIISSSKQDASIASSLIEEKQDFSNPECYLIYDTEDQLLNSIKKFVIFDKNKKVILSNAKNLEEIAKAINDIDNK